MAKKKKAVEPIGFTGLGTLKKLWKARPAREWLQLLMEIAPEHKWTLQGENTIKGSCPYHDDNTPSFFLMFNKQYGKCFGCEKFVVDLVSVIKNLKKDCSYVEAVLFIQNRFNLTDEIGQDADKLSAYHQVQEMKKETAIAMRQVIHEVVSTNAPELHYLKPGLAHLRLARELSLANLSEMPVGLFAKPEHLKKYISEKYQPAFDEYWVRKELQHSKNWGAIVFHYNDSPGSIARFKLRKADPVVLEGIRKKDKTFSSISVAQATQLFPSDMYTYVEDPYTQEVGIYGLHAYQHLLGRSQDPNAYVTEGEFDVLSSLDKQMSQASYDFVMLGTGGTGSLDVSFLKDYGVRTIWLVQDHPAKHGDNFARNFLKQKKNYTAAGAGVPLGIKVFQWPPRIVGLDLDEAMRKNDYAMLREALLVDRNATFMNSSVWIAAKCDEEIRQVKARMDQELSQLDLDEASDSVTIAVNNLKDNSRKDIHRCILDWFRFIHDPVDRQSFAQKYNTQEDIDITQDAHVHADVYDLGNRDGVIRKLKDGFNDYFEMSYYERTVTGKFVPYAWCKSSRENVAIPTSEREIGSIISQYVGREYVGWVEQQLRESSFWFFPGENVMVEEAKKVTVAKQWMAALADTLRSECKNKLHLTKVAQGIHHFGLPSNIYNKGFIYVVNGDQVFKGTINTETDMVEWELIENCVDENLYFELDYGSKWAFVNDVSDLYGASKIDLREVYEKIHTMLQGWSFANHEMTTKYLAAQILSLPIAAAIGNVNIMYVTGESESGKTSLIRGLLGGTQSEGHDLSPILESADAYLDLTPAKMYQKFDRASIALVYDEAEVSEMHNTAHDKKTVDIQRLIMTVPQGGARIGRGGQTSSQQSDYFFRMPIIMAGINLPTDRVFLSRVLVIYTQKKYGHRSLGDYISGKFKKAEIEQLRKDITVGLVPHIPELIRRRNAFKMRLYEQDIGRRVSDRFLDNILTPLLVYDYIGAGSGIELFKEMVAANKDRLEAIHGEEGSSALVDACLYKQAIKITHQDGMTDYTTPRHLIQSSDTHVLNNAASGVYYDGEKDWIVIVWRQAKHFILKDSVYSRMEDNALRERVAKTKYVVPEISDKDHERLRATFNLLEIKNSMGYSVIQGEYLGMTDINHEVNEQAQNLPANLRTAVVNHFEYGEDNYPEMAQDVPDLEEPEAADQPDVPDAEKGDFVL